MILLYGFELELPNIDLSDCLPKEFVAYVSTNNKVRIGKSWLIGDVFCINDWNYTEIENESKDEMMKTIEKILTKISKLEQIPDLPETIELKWYIEG
jgi:hypothetical protein